LQTAPAIHYSPLLAAPLSVFLPSSKATTTYASTPPTNLHKPRFRNLHIASDLLRTHARTHTHKASPHATTAIMRSKFKDEHPFEKRKAEAERIRQKYVLTYIVYSTRTTATELTPVYTGTKIASPSYVRRWKSRTLLPSTKRSTLSPRISP
jgi:hypothetical protein